MEEFEKFDGYTIDNLKKNKWEIVYFILTRCNGNCIHCWSSETYLGHQMPLIWHTNFFEKINPERIKSITISGGEPLLYKDLGNLIKIIRKILGDSVNIKIFTSGRGLVSIKNNYNGIFETYQNIKELGLIMPNLEIHLSADEHHSNALIKHIENINRSKGYDKIILLQNHVKNFLGACEIIQKNHYSDFSGKIKLHVEAGRLKFHRDKIYYWMNDNEWNKYVIKSEGVICAGSAKKLSKTLQIEETDQISLFLMPGAEFYKQPKTKYAQIYKSLDNKNLYLDKANVHGMGASIIGWWNIINRRFCGGTTYDTLSFLE